MTLETTKDYTSRTCRICGDTADRSSRKPCRVCGAHVRHTAEGSAPCSHRETFAGSGVCYLCGAAMPAPEPMDGDTADFQAAEVRGYAASRWEQLGGTSPSRHPAGTCSPLCPPCNQLLAEQYERTRPRPRVSHTFPNGVTCSDPSPIVWTNSEDCLHEGEIDSHYAEAPTAELESHNAAMDELRESQGVPAPPAMAVRYCDTYDPASRTCSHVLGH